jgi:hypothetical protein
MSCTEVSIITAPEEGTIVSQALKNLKDIDGMEVTGYKGEEFTLSADDTLFLVPDFNSSRESTTIVSITDYGLMEIESDTY